MKVISINVSPPIEVEYKGKIITTGIYKKPVEGPVYTALYNLEGDGQADLKNHGGADKSVYAYSFDHYAYWQEVLGKEDMPYGQFGENLTVSGLDELTSCIGDKLKIGNALFTITQPRVPCFKLGIRLNNKDMPKLFSKAARTGFYLKVLGEGIIHPGDTIETVSRGEHQVSVRSIFQAYFRPADKQGIDVLNRGLLVPELSSDWRQYIQQRLNKNEP